MNQPRRSSKHALEKFPLMNSFAFHTLGTSTERTDKSNCAQEFLSYIKSMGPIIQKNLARNMMGLINDEIPNEAHNEKYHKKILQCINLNLNPTDANELFPDLMSQVFVTQQDGQNEDEMGTRKQTTGKELYAEIYRRLNE